MRIKLKTSLAGHGYAHAAGDTVDRPDPEAIRLIAAGFAVPARGDDLEHTTDLDTAPTETRIAPGSPGSKKRPRKRRGGAGA